MAFWSAPGAEPLRQHRWYINFGGATDLNSIQYALKKVDKPKAKIGSVQHKYLNHYFNFPGRLEWEDINMTFASIIQPSAAATLMQILRNSGYGVPTDDTITEPSQRATLGKEKFAKQIGSFEIRQIDPSGVEIEKWTINRPFFTSVQFGSLDYGAEEIVEITCTVKYDWADFDYSRSDVGNGNDKDTPSYPGKPN